MRRYKLGYILRNPQVRTEFKMTVKMAISSG